VGTEVTEGDEGREVDGGWMYENERDEWRRGWSERNICVVDGREEVAKEVARRRIRKSLTEMEWA